MKYVRIQSKQYDINENSKSFEWEYIDSGLHQAMLEDIYYYEEFEGLEEWQREDFDNILNYNEKGITDEERKKLIEKFWNDIFGDRERGYAVLNGVSCYNANDIEDAAIKLYDYFVERDKESLESDKYYVLIFEGEYMGEGHNSEDVVKFEKEIERIEVKDFFSKYVSEEE